MAPNVEIEASKVGEIETAEIRNEIKAFKIREMEIFDGTRRISAR